MESDPLNLVITNLLPYSLFEYRAIKCSSLGCNSIIHRLQLLRLDSKHLDCCVVYLDTVWTWILYDYTEQYSHLFSFAAQKLVISQQTLHSHL